MPKVVKQKGTGIRIANLPSSTTRSDLEVLLKFLGPIHTIYMPEDVYLLFPPEGNETVPSQDFVYVYFRHELDAIKAVRVFNGYCYNGFVLTAYCVEPFKLPKPSKLVELKPETSNVNVVKPNQPLGAGKFTTGSNLGTRAKNKKIDKSNCKKGKKDHCNNSLTGAGKSSGSRGSTWPNLTHLGNKGVFKKKREHCICITNFSKSARNHLSKFVKSLGGTQKFYVLKFNEDLPDCIAYFHFKSRNKMEKAIAALTGYSYNNRVINIKRIGPFGGKSEMNAEAGGSKAPCPKKKKKKKPKNSKKLNKRNATTVYISNLNKYTTLEDLQSLVHSIGPTRKVHLEQFQGTDICQGFAYVHFKTTKDATKAISKLNGYGYQHLILHAEWSTPREEARIEEHKASFVEGVEQCKRLRKCYFKNDKVRFLVDGVHVEFKQRRVEWQSLDFFHPLAFV